MAVPVSRARTGRGRRELAGAGSAGRTGRHRRDRRLGLASGPADPGIGGSAGRPGVAVRRRASPGAGGCRRRRGGRRRAGRPVAGPVRAGRRGDPRRAAAGHPGAGAGHRPGRAAAAPHCANCCSFPLVAALLAGTLGGALGYALRGARRSPAAVDPRRRRRRRCRRWPSAHRDSLAGVAERVLPSVVTVRVRSLGGTSEGSGFIASSRRLRDHQRPRGGRRHRQGRRWSSTTAAPPPATVVGQDPESDIAVIKVTRTGLRAGGVRRLRRARRRRPGAGHRLAAVAGEHGHRRHRQRRWTGRCRPASRAARPATTRRSRPTPRSTTATPAARWSTAPAG